MEKTLCQDLMYLNDTRDFQKEEGMQTLTNERAIQQQQKLMKMWKR
jgi:hypothetical protein